MAQVVNVTPASQVSQVEINNRQLNVTVQKEVKSVDVTLETRGDISVEISRAVSQTGVQNIIGGADISVSNVAGNVTVSFAPDGFTSTGNITAPYFLGNVIGNISGNIVVPGLNTDVLYNNNGNVGANDNFQYNSANATLTVTGNIVATNISGNGSGLSAIAGANVTGTVANATYATSAGTATSAITATSATTAGTVTTNAQPNITSVGTLSSVSVTGNVTAGNIKSDNLLYANGSPYQFTTNAAGTNTQVQFNDNNSFGADSTFTFNKTTGLVSATGFSGNGAQLTSITGANVTGIVANATHATSADSATSATTATTAGAVTANAQPNITSVGILNGLSVSGSIVPTANVMYDLGDNTHRFKDIYLSGTTIYLGAQTITTDASGISMTGSINGDGGALSNVQAANIVGDFPSITVTTDANVGGNLIVTNNLVVHGNTIYTNVDTLVVQDPIIEMGGGPNGDPLTTNDGKDRGDLLHYYTTSPVDAFMGWKNTSGEFIFGSNVTNTNEVISVNTYGNIRAQHVYATIDGANVIGEVQSAGHALTADNATQSDYAVTAGDSVTAGYATTASVADEAYSVAVANVVGIGNIATVNLDNSTTNVLYGNGVFAALPSTANANYANYAGNILVNAGNANASTDRFFTFITANNITGNYTLESQPGIHFWPLANLLYVKNTIQVPVWSSDSTTFLTADRELRVANAVTTGRFISNVATGTAPFTVTSTTTVANLSVANATYANSAGTATTAGTVTTNAQPNITSVGANLTVTNSIRTSNIVAQTGGITTMQLRYGGVEGSVGITTDLTLGAAGEGNLTTVGNITLNTFIGNGGTIKGDGNITIAPTGNVILGANSKVKITGGTSGQVLSTDGLGNLSWVTGGGGGGGTPGGLPTQLQFNDSGSFGGISTVTYDGSNISLGTVSTVKITGGTSGQVLSTDGTGNLSWANQSGGGTTDFVPSFLLGGM